MPYEAYIDKNFAPATLSVIKQARAIIDDYMAQGFTLTLRQLYYQFVARDLIANKQSEYKRLGSVMNDARLAGLVDWNAIEDRTRNLRRQPHWNSPQEILASCASQFAFDKWADQPCRIEVWIEKDALLGVVEPSCRDLDVPYFACRGYSSQSEQWRAAKRFKKHSYAGQECVIIHLGDHDPSGVDMTRDNQDRLDIFLPDMVTVRRIALNWNQIEEHKPPPNPAKLTDTRAKDYIARFGDDSWELDALDLRVIDGLIRSVVLEYRDEEAWEAAVEREQQVKDRLADVAKAAEDWE